VSEAAWVYRDLARGRRFDAAELKEIAASVGDEVNFQSRSDHTLAPSDILALLNPIAAQYASEWGPLLPGKNLKTGRFDQTPLGPTEPCSVPSATVTTTWNQFARTAAWVQQSLDVHGRVPPTVWLGTTGVSPESYYAALARVVPQLLDGKTPESIELRPAKFTVGARVADDSPKIFGWLFAPGYHAPAMMELARRQAWTIKPAIAHRE